MWQRPTNGAASTGAASPCCCPPVDGMRVNASATTTETSGC
jgi:hypothetical protein